MNDFYTAGAAPGASPTLLLLRVLLSCLPLFLRFCFVSSFARRPATWDTRRHPLVLRDPTQIRQPYDILGTRKEVPETLQPPSCLGKCLIQMFEIAGPDPCLGMFRFFIIVLGAVWDHPSLKNVPGGVGGTPKIGF